MILYKDNPKLRLKVVTTVRGDSEYRKNCKFIREKYYLMNRDVFYIKDKWYTFDGGKIVFDHERKEWLLNDKEVESLLQGVVGFNADGTAILGRFTSNPYNNVRARVTPHGVQVSLNTNILLDNGFIEDVSNGVWYSKKDLGAAGIKRAKTIRNERAFTDRGYNIEENPKDYKLKVQLYEAYTPVISKEARIYSKFLGDLSFGNEFEIYRGNMPAHLQNRNGIVICRDGSIDGGPELVTIPMSGAKGLQTVKNICSDLETRGDININCSYHVHFGNTRTDKLFLAAFYILCMKIQDELFTMFPYYKTDHRGIKRRNYNQKLDSLGIHPLVRTDKDSYETYLVDVYSRIFEFLAEGRITLDQFNKRTREHPIPRKWERSSRYYWANLMNMFFGNRHTCEFRLHQATTNPHKVINWMFICAAIIRYAERCSKEIITGKENISVREVLNVFGALYPDDKNASFLSEYLYAYFLHRQRQFAKDLKNGDKISEWDMTDDKSFTFAHNGVSGLI